MTWKLVDVAAAVNAKTLCSGVGGWLKQQRSCWSIDCRSHPLSEDVTLTFELLTSVWHGYTSGPQRLTWTLRNFPFLTRWQAWDGTDIGTANRQLDITHSYWETGLVYTTRVDGMAREHGCVPTHSAWLHADCWLPNHVQLNEHRFSGVL